MNRRYLFVPYVSAMLAALISQGPGLAMRQGEHATGGAQDRIPQPLARPNVVTGVPPGGHLMSMHVSPPRSGQQGGVGASTDGLPLAVDGAKNPEMISDDLAYRHFISVSAVSKAASPESIARRDAFLARVGLSPEDRTAFVDAVSTVRDALAALDEQRRIAGNDRADALRLQYGQVLDEAATRTRAALSAAGAERLHAHIVDHVKRHIRVYGQAE